MTWGRTTVGLFAYALALVACSGTDSVTIGGRDLEAPSSGATTGAATGTRAADAGGGRAGEGRDAGAALADSSATDTADALPAPSPGAMPTVDQIRALTARCNAASNGKYAPHAGLPQSVDICRLNGAFFWTSELLVDCDGQPTPQCQGVAGRQNETAVTQSDGKPLNPATLPFVVLPAPSAIFNYVTADIREGAVALVLSGGSMAIGIFGDTGPDNMIGEASYAMAQSLGIDPNPLTGGRSSGVTYIVFTGAAAPSPVEDHQAAVTLAQSLATALVANN